MGIPIGGRKRRRSYADYRPPAQNPGPRNDPFRIVFYIAVIAGATWAYFNQDTVKARLSDTILPLQEFQDDASSQPSETGGATEGEPAGQDATALAAEALAAYEAGQIEEAVALYRQAHLMDPNQPEYPYQVARLLLYEAGIQYGQQREQTLLEALEAADQAILADPEGPYGYAIVGKVVNWQGRPEEALNQIQLAIEIEPEFAVAHSYLAESQVDLERWEQSVETIQYALSLDPQNVDIRRDYGYILENLGDWSSAAVQYETALVQAPNLPYLHVALARIYRVLARNNEALDQLFVAATLEPENALIQLELGLTYESYVGDPNTAIEYYNRALELDPEYTAAWVRVGTVRYVQQLYDQAIPAFERSLELGADANSIYYQLGYAYAQQGQCQQAVPRLTEALNRYPESEENEPIRELVAEAFELCEQPTPTPNPDPTLTPDSSTNSETESGA